MATERSGPMADLERARAVQLFARGKRPILPPEPRGKIMEDGSTQQVRPQ